MNYSKLETKLYIKILYLFSLIPPNLEIKNILERHIYIYNLQSYLKQGKIFLLYLNNNNNYNSFPYKILL